MLSKKTIYVFICFSHDATLDFNPGQYHFLRGQVKDSVLQNWHICDFPCGSFGYRDYHSANTAQGGQIPGANLEAICGVPDCLHRRFCHLHKCLPLQTVHLAGEAEWLKKLYGTLAVRKLN